MDKAVSSNGSKKIFLLAILAFLLCVTIAVGFSYAVWTQTKEQDVANTFTVGCFDIQISKEENAINLGNDYPITDDNGKTRTPFTFTVTNTCDYYGNYAVNLEKLTTSNMESQFIKVMLDDYNPNFYDKYPNGEVQSEDSTESRILFTGGLAPNESATHNLRIWIDYDATVDDVGGKTFNSKIVVTSVAANTYCDENPDAIICKNQSHLAFDDPEQNLRYIGSTPNNYVEFNGETWRIIGVFNTYVCDDERTGVLDDYKTDPTCKQEELLKIIKSDSISPQAMAWDTTGTYGKNDWSTATLQTALNNDYFGNTGTYVNNGLNTAAQGMVANVVWTLGGPGDEYQTDGTPQYFYEKERSDTVYEGNPKAFVGKVGLMFPSDYGYATGGSTSTSRTTCLANEMYNWQNLSECYNNDWLFNSSYYQWTLSSHSIYSNRVFRVRGTGSLDTDNAFGVFVIRPVVYLKSDVQIIDGTGEMNDPYQLGYEGDLPEQSGIDEVIAAKADSSQIAKDDPENNLRYIGPNPNNYVKFNDETWRIIGVFNTYVCDDGTSEVLDNYKDSSTCKQEKLLKIIKSDFLSTSMAWDTNNVNDWSKATLQTALNGDYFKRTGTYSSNGLNSTAQGMVANVVWTLGGTANYDSASNGLASHFYGYERGDTVPSGNPKAFVGHVGLMFPSDYGYATSGGTTGRDTCLAKEMYRWDSGSYKTDCAGGSWLYNSSTYQWTLSPRSVSSSYVFRVNGGGSVGSSRASSAYGVRPVVYLKSSVKILDDGMDGSSTKPYNLNL